MPSINNASSTTEETINWGLEGINVTSTTLSKVDGLKGKLTLAGYSLEELAPNATFEEMIFLFWNNRLPTQIELDELSNQIQINREINEITKSTLKRAAENKMHSMDALKLGIAIQGIDYGNSENQDIEKTKMIATKLVSIVPTILAAYWRYLDGNDYVSPKKTLGYAENFLYMLTGKVPEKHIARALEIYLITVADHGLNASTFVARAIISTESDIISAVLGAIGSLKGPAHGGAPGPALDMVFEIGDVVNAEPYIRRKLENKERIMGFGHRVYKVRDPRAQVLADAAKDLFIGDKAEFFDRVHQIEKIIVRLLEEYKPGRNLYTNVEFYTALVLHGCDLKPEIFSSIFAMGRTIGWTAHIIEQMENNRLIRPRAVYSGEFDKKWKKMINR